MSKYGKKFAQAKSKVDRWKYYSFEEGLALALDVSFVNFNETVDLAVRLGVDPRHADQMVRGTVSLPHGTGKKVTVAVFAKGEKEKEAKDAGADFVGAEDLVSKIQKNWVGFDRAIATPDMMSQVGKLGRILGPRGLMPNAKSGTVTFDITKAVKEIKAGRIEFRVDKGGVIHAPIGKCDFGEKKVFENMISLVKKILKLKPAAAKGTYIKGLSVSTTMGPGIKLDILELRSLVK